MSAGTYAYVSCDGRDSDAAPGRRLCPERIEEGRTEAQARKIARERGWLTCVHADGSKPIRGIGLGLFDYCPAHKPS